MSRVFRYLSDEVVQTGDRVRDSGRLGCVAEVIQPGSATAVSCNCPEGGVLTMSDFDGAEIPRIWMPQDGDWEDLEFLGREGYDT